jgi:DNA-binding NtrC family response regulator
MIPDGTRVLWISSRGSESSTAAPDTFVRATVESALTRHDIRDFDVILLALPQRGWGSLDLVESLRKAAPSARIVVQSSRPPTGGFEAARLHEAGVFQVVCNYEIPNDAISQETRAALERAAHAGRVRGDADEAWRKLIVGESRAIRRIGEIIRLVAKRRCTVLIQGETGTGKEVVARAIHAASGRNPFVAINCSALPESLLEAELFGHVRGAFTGAIHHRAGRFEQAHGGTLFLDEIGEMPVSLQAKLLRVLQEREVQRLGSPESTKVDIRVVAATNANLPERVRQGRFREDLYYRLNVVPVTLPSLRERTEDIPFLVRYFLDKVCREEAGPPKIVSPDTLGRLSRLEWPGNVRQLENAVEMAIALSGDRELLDISDFPVVSTAPANSLPAGLPFFAVPDHGLDFEETLGSIEHSILEQALRLAGGNKTVAADLLRLKRTTLTAKLKAWEGIEAPAVAAASA